MAERRPIVLIDGKLKELPSLDTLPGIGGAVSLAVEEDGTEESASIKRLNFTGLVDVSVSGDEATVNILGDGNSGGGGGGGTGTLTHYNSWGLSIVSQVDTYASGIVPTNYVWKNNTPGVIVSADDGALLHGLTFQAGGNLGNGANEYFDIPVEADGTTKTFILRYRTQGEQGYDGLFVNLDGVTQHNNWVTDSGWIEYSFILSAGAHTVRVGYRSDGSATSGWQNLKITRLTYPRNAPGATYLKGDTVDHEGFTWLCIVAGTAQEPADGASDWAKLDSSEEEEPVSTFSYRYGGFAIASIGASEILMDHVVTVAHRLPPGLEKSRFSVGTPPAAPFILVVKKNDVQVGTVTISATGVATVSFLNVVDVLAGEVMSLHAPGSADAAIGRLRFTFEATEIPSGTYPSATQWRVRTTTGGLAQPYDQIGGEWYWRETPGGANIDLSLVTDITSGDEFPTSNLRNGNVNDFHQWNGNIPLPRWAGVIFPQARAIRELVIHPSTSYTNRGPRDILVEYSLNGSLWTTVFQKTGITWTTNVPQTFSW
jgi:hypothetical protein